MRFYPTDGPEHPAAWRRSALFGERASRLRAWWQRDELWEELGRLWVAEFRYVEEMTMEMQRIEAIRQPLVADYIKKTAPARRRWGGLKRALRGSQQRQAAMYRRLLQAERARKRGGVLLDPEELKRLIRRGVEVKDAQRRSGRRTQRMRHEKGPQGRQP